MFLSPRMLFVMRADSGGDENEKMKLSIVTLTFGSVVDFCCVF